MENPLSLNLLFLVMAEISAIGSQRAKKIACTIGAIKRI